MDGPVCVRASRTGRQEGQENSEKTNFGKLVCIQMDGSERRSLSGCPITPPFEGKSQKPTRPLRLALHVLLALSLSKWPVEGAGEG